jgi:glutamate---cysteine ligase / carboxylate-amine ligase
VAKVKTALTIGLEEELFLVDRQSKDLCSSWPKEFSQECNSKYPNQIVHEFLNSQIELISKPHSNICDLEDEFSSLRSHVIACSERYNMASIAASTHPFAHWKDQTTSENKRYSRLETDLKLPAKRMLVSGMHVHIGIDDNEKRIEYLNKIAGYLPLILILSSSSPFWQGLDSGLNSMRLSVLNGLPRSGLPEIFNQYADYETYIQFLIKSNAIQGAREIWWDARLSANFPTVEIRIADTCTSLKDSMAICALIQCLSQYLLNNDTKPITHLQAYIAKENRWRAQRYPIESGSLIDLQTMKTVSYKTIVEQLLNLLGATAKELNNLHYLEHLLDIVQQGTSADKQRAIYNQSLSQNNNKQASLQKVVEFLIDETQSSINFKKKNDDKKIAYRQHNAISI